MSSRSSERFISPGSLVSAGDPKRRVAAALRVVMISAKDDAYVDSNEFRLFFAPYWQSLQIRRLMGAAGKVNDVTNEPIFCKEPNRKEAHSNVDDGEE